MSTLLKPLFIDFLCYMPSSKVRNILEKDSCIYAIIRDSKILFVSIN